MSDMSNKCNAATKKNTPCQRTVSQQNERCYQHRQDSRLLLNDCPKQSLRRVYIPSDRDRIIRKIFSPDGGVNVTINDNMKKLVIEMAGHAYIFRPHANMGRGSYGQIIRMKCRELDMFLCIKIEQGQPTERDISRQLIANNNECDILRVRFIREIPHQNNRRSRFVYVMENMEGNIHELISAYRERPVHEFNIMVHHLAENLRRQLVCLLKNGYYYIDFKIPNILYRQTGHRSYEVLLGDLGSMNVDSNGYMACTIPPPEAGSDGSHMKRDWLRARNRIHYILSWFIGTFYLYALRIYKHLDPSIVNASDLSYVHSHPVRIKNRHNARRIVTRWFGERIGLYLKKRPKSRPSIFKPII